MKALFKYKIRFNLSRGEHFMHWQIKNSYGDVVYHDPNDTQIEMFNCKLKNRVNIANEIFNGENKRVCAWVECENFKITEGTRCQFNSNDQIKYNPRNSPNWLNSKGENIDNKVFCELITNGNKIYEII
jgi:hypothetical protein